MASTRKSISDWQRMTARKPSKYGNEPLEIDGHKFPSRKEARRYAQLKILERAGKISNLQLQVPYELQPAFKHPQTNKTIRAIKYVADFVYTDSETGKVHIEDTKGFRTKEYELKKKMMLYHGFIIEEI